MTAIRNYEVIEDHGRYTIGEIAPGTDSHIINDGICTYYWWGTRSQAQEAADAINTYGAYWLGQHGYGNDRLTATEAERLLGSDPDMVDVYRAFNAIDDDKVDYPVADDNEWAWCAACGLVVRRDANSDNSPWVAYGDIDKCDLPDGLISDGMPEIECDDCAKRNATGENGGEDD